MSEIKRQHHITEQQYKDFWKAIVIFSRQTKIEYKKKDRARKEQARELIESLRKINKL